MRRIVSACGDSCSACGDRCSALRMRRLVFRVQRNVSACGDSCSACGETTPHAETRVPSAEDPVFRVRRTRSPHAETRAKLRVLRKRQLHMIGNYNSFSSEDYATPCTCYGTPRKLLLPTDPWVITGYICTVHMRVVLASLKGPKTRKRSLTWRPNTRHMALSVLQLECVIQSSHDGCSAGDSPENALAFRAVEVHTLVHELRKLLPQLLAD